MVSITKEGDTETGTTDDGVNYKVTYVDTDYGDDGQINWDMSTLQMLALIYRMTLKLHSAHIDYNSK